MNHISCILGTVNRLSLADHYRDLQQRTLLSHPRNPHISIDSIDAASRIFHKSPAFVYFEPTTSSAHFTGPAVYIQFNEKRVRLEVQKSNGTHLMISSLRCAFCRRWPPRSYDFFSFGLVYIAFRLRGYIWSWARKKFIWCFGLGFEESPVLDFLLHFVVGFARSAPRILVHNCIVIWYCRRHHTPIFLCLGWQAKLFLYHGWDIGIAQKRYFLYMGMDGIGGFVFC